MKAWTACEGGWVRNGVAQGQWSSVTEGPRRVGSFTQRRARRPRRAPVNCISGTGARLLQVERPPAPDRREGARGADRRAPFRGATSSRRPTSQRAGGLRAQGQRARRGLEVDPPARGWLYGDRAGGIVPRREGPFGVHDLAGNVANWTASAHCPTRGTTARASCARFVVRRSRRTTCVRSASRTDGSAARRPTWVSAARADPPLVQRGTR